MTGLEPSALRERIGDYDALVVRSETKVTAEVFAAAPRLRVVGRAGVGVDNIDIEAATRHGVLVLNAPTGNTIAATEHVIAMMLALARNLPAADRSLHAGLWERSKFMGIELREKTLGVLGLGKIGSEVARIAREGLHMRVLAHDPLVTAERAHQAGVELVRLRDAADRNRLPHRPRPAHRCDPRRDRRGRAAADAQGCAPDQRRPRRHHRRAGARRCDPRRAHRRRRHRRLHQGAARPGEPAAPARQGGGHAPSRREHARGPGERRFRRRRPDRRVPGRRHAALRGQRAHGAARGARHGSSPTWCSPRRSARLRRSSTVASCATWCAATRASLPASTRRSSPRTSCAGSSRTSPRRASTPSTPRWWPPSMGVDVDERHTTRSVDPEGSLLVEVRRRGDPAHRGHAVR